MQHAGLGYPNGPVDNEKIFVFPSPKLLMLSTEGRYHHDEAVKAGKDVLWRAIPRRGKRPAELGWSSHKFVGEALNLTTEPTLPIREFIPWNELDLQDERGDQDDDWNDLPKRYAMIGGWADGVYSGLRGALPGTRLHFPAFTPDHFALSYQEYWGKTAEKFDVIDFHAYDSMDKIAAAYYDYREAFPGKPLALTEWHCKGDAAEEYEVLDWLSQVMVADPFFEAAYFFIYRWDNSPGWWSENYDIQHNPERVKLFMNPPLLHVDPPVPEEPPMPPVTTYPLGIDVSNNNGGIVWDKVVNAGVQFGIAKITEGVGFRDGYFQDNWAEMKRLGLVRGAYHFALPSQTGAVAEADYFVDAFAALGEYLEPGDFVALDLEDPAARGDLSGWTFDWLQRVEQRLGFKPLVYSSPAYINEHGLANIPQIGEYGLWLARWGIPTPPPAPAPWSLVAIHQTHVGAAGSMPGVQGEIDMNRFNGDIESLKRYGMPGASAPLPPPPPIPEPTSEVEALRAQVAGLLSQRGYLRDTVAPALRKEASTIQNGLDALIAAIETLERETTG